MVNGLRSSNFEGVGEGWEEFRDLQSELTAILWLTAYSFEYFPLDCVQSHIVYSPKY